MRVSYRKFFEKLKEYKLTQKQFKEKTGISSGTMGKLINNESITTNSICRICDYFHCMPDEIIEWIPDADYESANAEKLAIEAQIAELQAKLKQM